jgi:hypothetical protein
MEYAIRAADGTIIVGPGWACEADALAGHRAHSTSKKVDGTLVRRNNDAADWQPVHLKKEA